MGETVEVKEGMAAIIDVSETCVECGKIFDKSSAMQNKNALRGHMISHKRKMPGRGHKGPRPLIGQPLPDVDINSARQRSETASETLEQKVARLRKERKPIGAPEKKWSCPVNDGYQYRVFNDDWMTRPGNIQKAQSAGYEFVQSDDDKQKPQIVGTNDNGTPIRGFLMRIPKVIYDEDQAAKQKPVDAVDEQIRKGSFQQGAGDNRYIPATGIKIMTNHQPPG